MYDYRLSDGLPSGSRTVWSNLSLRPLCSGVLTPLSYSVLSEIAGRAWYTYFDRLGFDPTPRARVLRQYEGRAYLNLTISAQRDAEGAAVEPITLRLDGQPFPITKWEKPGFLAGIKFGLAQNKIDQLAKTFAGELETLTQQAQSWYAKSNDIRWTQAEVLQIMEEIENIGVRSFTVWLAARHNLDRSYNRLVHWSAERAGYPANLALIAAATPLDKLVETTILTELHSLAQTVAANPTVLAWLQAGDFADWQNTLPDPQFVTTLQTFLSRFGHRTLQEGELRHPRWEEEPAAIFAMLAAWPPSQPITPPAANPDPFLATIGADRRKEAQNLLQRIGTLHTLQSQAQHAFAYVLAGTRRWALAAARDAMVDQRLLALDDGFFYELEQLKEMMTGEWNISKRDEIQTVCRHRRARHKKWEAATPSELLIGEQEAQPEPVELPGSFIGSLAAYLSSAG